MIRKKDTQIKKTDFDRVLYNAFKRPDSKTKDRIFWKDLNWQKICNIKAETTQNKKKAYRQIIVSENKIQPPGRHSDHFKKSNYLSIKGENI